MNKKEEKVIFMGRVNILNISKTQKKNCAYENCKTAPCVLRRRSENSSCRFKIH